MTSSIAAGAPSNSKGLPFNLNEIAKFLIISAVWLSITFGAVWILSWVVGMLLPHLILKLAGSSNPTVVMIADACKGLTPLVAVMVFIPINATYMVLAERRGLALFTVRKGPNRVGPDGFLQTAADAVKLLFKENINPSGADVLMFTLAPIVFFAPSVFGALPLLAAVTSNHELFQVVNLPTGIFYVLAMSSIPVVGIVMGGWASNNKYSLVGGLRSAAQAISYEIPLVLAVVTICYMVGELDVVKIVSAQFDQQIGIFGWNLLGGGILQKAHLHPYNLVVAVATAFICIILFGIYATGACAEINRIPFDLPEAESELVSGYNTEYSGIRFAIFFLAEFTNLFIVSTIATVMWLGGGTSPLPGTPELLLFQLLSAGVNFIPSSIGLPPLMDAGVACGAFWALAKTYALIFFAILVRGTLPRFRIDQLLDFGWKRLIPLSLFLLLVMTWLKEALN